MQYYSLFARSRSMVSLMARLMKAVASLIKPQTVACEIVVENCISMVLGGSGTGKSALISAMASAHQHAPDSVLVCSATAQGASAFMGEYGGMCHVVQQVLEDEDGVLEGKKLILVDNAECLTLLQLCDLMENKHPKCRLVLFGNDHVPFYQGAGNVIFDLQALNVPVAQMPFPMTAPVQSALSNNLKEVDDMGTISKLYQDDSFQVHICPEENLVKAVMTDATPYLKDKLNFKIICSSSTKVEELNPLCQEIANPVPPVEDTDFRQGDAVMVLNASLEGMYHGEVGNITFPQNDTETVACFFSGDRHVIYSGGSWDEEDYTLGYAVPMELSMSGTYETVFILLDDQDVLLNRNLLFAIAGRASKAVHIYATKEVLARTLATVPNMPYTHLVECTNMALDRLQSVEEYEHAYDEDEADYDEFGA